MFLLEKTLLGPLDPLAMVVFRVGPNPRPRNSPEVEVEVEVSGRSPRFDVPLQNHSMIFTVTDRNLCFSSSHSRTVEQCRI
jgi:hypothetical protein